jgi:hypothetical protein
LFVCRYIVVLYHQPNTKSVAPVKMDVDAKRAELDGMKKKFGVAGMEQ